MDHKKATPLGFKEYLDQKVKDGYIKENGEPIKCHFCDSVDIIFKITDRIEIDATIGAFIDSEGVTTCLDCEKEIGHWMQGNWEPL